MGIFAVDTSVLQGSGIRLGRRSGELVGITARVEAALGAAAASELIGRAFGGYTDIEALRNAGAEWAVALPRAGSAVVDLSRDLGVTARSYDEAERGNLSRWAAL